MKVAHTIVLNVIPIVLMIGLIPFVQNDTVLTGIYIAIIVIALIIHREPRDSVFFAFGFIALFISEYFFISTGVETFTRQSLFGVMPIWLPILWGYVFIAIPRGMALLSK